LAEGEGTPAVVIVPALGDSVLGWVRVQRAAAAETSIVVCDRAGIGWSDPPRLGKLTWDGMADDLHAALAAARIEPPYIIVGHSIGGIVARRFQARYPADVTGLLLVDSSHDEQSRRFGWREGSGEQLRHAAQYQSRVLGARRLAAALWRLKVVDPDGLERETAPEYAAVARAVTLSSRQRRIGVREMILAAKLRSRPPQAIGALPLTVLSTASRSLSWWPVWGADAGRNRRALHRRRPYDRAEGPGITCTWTSLSSSCTRFATSSSGAARAPEGLHPPVGLLEHSVGNRLVQTNCRVRRSSSRRHPLAVMTVAAPAAIVSILSEAERTRPWLPSGAPGTLRR
jgi:pimeloyl-ACP methyl ester carboxylesterase